MLVKSNAMVVREMGKPFVMRSCTCDAKSFCFFIWFNLKLTCKIIHEYLKI